MMIQEIDFLPQGYHRNRERSYNKIISRAMLVIVVVFLWSAHYRQQQSLNSLKVERDRVRSKQTHSQLQTTDDLQRELQYLTSRANLVTALGTRVPPTRLLADVTNSLPRFVWLTEFRTYREKIVPQSTTEAPAVKNAASLEQSNRLPQEQDFDQLKNLKQTSARYLSLTGLAPDDAAIAAYLATLEETGTFETLELLSSDPTFFRESSLRKFVIRLRVRQPKSSSSNNEKLAIRVEKDELRTLAQKETIRSPKAVELIGPRLYSGRNHP